MELAVDARTLAGILQEAGAARNGPWAIALDGDGTIWRGDVADDVFFALAGADRLRPAAGAALAAMARRYALDAAGTPSAVALRLHQAYLAGRIPQDEAYAMMTWCFAGYAPAELHHQAVGILAADGLAARLRPEVMVVVEAVRRHGGRAIVVSASPHPIVEAAGAVAGFSPDDVIGSRCRLEGGLMAPELDGPLVYGAAKPPAARALLGPGDGAKGALAGPRSDAHLVAAFGDSLFDLELLLAADLGVAVAPRRGLVEALQARHRRARLLVEG